LVLELFIAQQLCYETKTARATNFTASASVKNAVWETWKKTRFSAGQAKRNIGLARKTQSDGRTGGETAKQTTDVIEVVAIG
jgi:hypothetical protein